MSLISFGTNMEVGPLIARSSEYSKSKLPIDANKIIDRLWQGSKPPSGNILRELGFDVLVLAAMEHQIPASEFPGMTVIHVPLDDAKYVPSEEARRVAYRVAKMWRRGARILITCSMGLNRSGLILALVIRYITGKSGIEAVADVQRARRGALFNPYFRKYLERLPSFKIKKT